MTDEIRTPDEALEAAAQVAFAAMIRGNSANVAEEIRALAARIPERDDEALVERCARAMNSAWCYAPEGTPDWGLFWFRQRDQYRKQARAVLTALREARALK